MITVDDDLFHPRNDDPYWNESSFITFCVPERGINGLVYFYHRPNMKLSAGGPIMWGPPGGEEIYNCLHWDWDDCQPMPEGAEMYDFSLPNGLSVETTALQKSYRMRYTREDLRMDLTWEGFLEPQEMRRVEGKVNRGIVEWITDRGVVDLAIGHYETFGRVAGTISFDGASWPDSLRGSTVQVNCFALRDHSWGPRTLDGWPRTGWSFGIASEASSFMAISSCERRWDDDPIDGTTESIVAGWYVKDGVKGNLVSGARRVVKRGDDGRPVTETISATDDLGRELRAEGEAVSLLKWTGYNDCFVWYNLASWEFDGQRCWGELDEYYLFRQARRYQHQLGRG
jgi:hypothetical protein